VRLSSRDSREGAVILDASSYERYSCGIVPFRLFREWFGSMGIDMRSENSVSAVVHGVSADMDGEKRLLRVFAIRRVPVPLCGLIRSIGGRLPSGQRFLRIRHGIS